MCMEMSTFILELNIVLEYSVSYISAITEEWLLLEGGFGFESLANLTDLDWNCVAQPLIRTSISA